MNTHSLGFPIREKLKRRTSIPKRPQISVNLWSIIKTSIGRDLSRIPMPVNFSEPLSMLQRLTEDYAYADILDRAATCSDNLEQLAYVAAFTVSTYATTACRVNKPFNPLLGETYECDRTDDLGWRSISEQVSHHPPVAAMHVESRDWVAWQELSMQSKFRGKFLQVTPLGSSHLRFPRTNNSYTWKKVTLTVHNIVFGKLWIDNSGEVEIVNKTTGDKCQLHYKPYSYFSSNSHKRVTGSVIDSSGTVRYILDGGWDSNIDMMQVTNPIPVVIPAVAASTNPASHLSQQPVVVTGQARTLWKRLPQQPHADNQYHFTEFTIQLNQVEEGVAPTDSRNRPDQRLMEQGKWEEANLEKMRLEDKQRRQMRHQQSAGEVGGAAGGGGGRKLGGKSAPMLEEDDSMDSEKEGVEFEPDETLEYQPKWFSREKNPVTSANHFLYKGEYWECKQRQKWDRCPNIF